MTTLVYVTLIVNINISDLLFASSYFSLSYLDANIEHQMPMTAANSFWLDTLHDCKFNQSLSLPFDQYRLLGEHRTGRGTSISFDFDEHLSQKFISFALSNNHTTLQHLAFACFYAFLF